MYQFLDRQVTALAEPHRFIIVAMRAWVTAARSGACPCAALSEGFAERGVTGALRDFTIAMTTLDHHGTAVFHFGPIACRCVSDDEARLLALFDAAANGGAVQVHRIAAALVKPGATRALATAVDWVMTRLQETPFAQEK